MWIKYGQIYTGGGIILDGKRYWAPTDEQFIAAGWLAEDDPAFAAVPATLTDEKRGVCLR